MAGDEGGADFDGVEADGAGAEEDGEEFGVGECGGAEPLHFFAGSVGFREVVETGGRRGGILRHGGERMALVEFGATEIAGNY